MKISLEDGRTFDAPDTPWLYHWMPRALRRRWLWWWLRHWKER